MYFRNLWGGSLWKINHKVYSYFSYDVKKFKIQYDENWCSVNNTYWHILCPKLLILTRCLFVICEVQILMMIKKDVRRNLQWFQRLSQLRNLIKTNCFIEEKQKNCMNIGYDSWSHKLGQEVNSMCAVP